MLAAIPLAIKRTLYNSVPVLWLRKREYEQRFANSTRANLFKGVFDTFKEASDSAPSTKVLGYDHPEPAKMYRERASKVYPSDYPVLFWLKNILNDHSSVFDLGGHIGVSYYAYKKFISYPKNIKWQVCDVESVTESGKDFAEQQESDGLSFTNEYKHIEGHDIVLASGSIQYIDIPFAEMLDKLVKKPKHIIINLLPLYEGETFVTLQNIGSVFCPYRAFNKTDFVESIIQQGYQLKDIWENAEKSCHIPFDSEHSLDVYHGLYFIYQGKS